MTLDRTDAAFAANIAADGGTVQELEGGGLDALVVGARADGVARERGQPDGRVAAISWRRPLAATPSDPEYQLAARLARRWVRLHAELERIAADPRLSSTAKADDREAAILTARDEVELIARDAEGMVAKFEHADRDEARAPALAAGDLVGALRDQEARAWVRCLDEAGRADLVRKIAAGEHEAIAYAILRAPAPEFTTGVLGAGLVRAVVEAQAQRDPSTAKRRADGRDRIDFLRRVLTEVRNGIPPTRHSVAEAAAQAQRDHEAQRDRARAA